MIPTKYPLLRSPCGFDGLYRYGRRGVEVIKLPLDRSVFDISNARSFLRPRWGYGPMTFACGSPTPPMSLSPPTHHTKFCGICYIQVYNTKSRVIYGTFIIFLNFGPTLSFSESALPPIIYSLRRRQPVPLSQFRITRIYLPHTLLSETCVNLVQVLPHIHFFVF